MDHRVATAVLNNIVWCGIVCETHGIACASNENVWGLLGPAPTYYPDIITVNRYTTTEEVRDFMGEKPIFSIKDSYANLDLSSFGFNVLFEANWIYHAPVVDLSSVEIGWKLVKTEDNLRKWTTAHGSGTTIRPELLNRDDVKIFMHEGKHGISGFIASVGADAVGISNVFLAHTEHDRLWPGIAQAVSATFPGLSLVGYEQPEDLISAYGCGWTSVGPLRVWIKANV